MVLRIQIAKFKFRQYLLRANLPNLMLAKLSHYYGTMYSEVTPNVGTEVLWGHPKP